MYITKLTYNVNASESIQHRGCEMFLFGYGAEHSENKQTDIHEELWLTVLSFGKRILNEQKVREALW